MFTLQAQKIATYSWQVDDLLYSRTLIDNVRVLVPCVILLSTNQFGISVQLFRMVLGDGGERFPGLCFSQGGFGIAIKELWKDNSMPTIYNRAQKCWHNWFGRVSPIISESKVQDQLSISRKSEKPHKRRKKASYLLAPPSTLVADTRWWRDTINCHCSTKLTDSIQLQEFANKRIDTSKFI